jgi:hypothetical protein
MYALLRKQPKDLQETIIQLPEFPFALQSAYGNNCSRGGGRQQEKLHTPLLIVLHTTYKMRLPHPGSQ